jgi:hypothetical protein
MRKVAGGISTYVKPSFGFTLVALRGRGGPFCADSGAALGGPLCRFCGTWGAAAPFSPS